MFTKEELKVIKKLETPRKIQDFLDSLNINFELEGDTCRSPRMVLRTGEAHCIEGALLAAVILKYHGYKPLIVDLEAAKNDFDHVIVVYKKKGYWGAITKSNHSCLRYREPVYKTVRELVMSYFHEYFLNSNGKKTLRKYSKPINLDRFNKTGWQFDEKNVWLIPEHLCEVKHYPILQRWQLKGLRKADRIEIESGKLVCQSDPLERKDGI